MHLARKKVADRIERMIPDPEVIEAAIDQELDRLLPLNNQNPETSTEPSNDSQASSELTPDH